MLEASLRTKLQHSILPNVNHDKSLHSLPAVKRHDKCEKWLEQLHNKENLDADADVRLAVGNEKLVHHKATSFARIGEIRAHTMDKKCNVDQHRTGAKRKLFTKCKHVTDEIGPEVHKRRRSQAVDSLSGIETICASECIIDREKYSNYSRGQPGGKYKRKPFGIVENCAHDVQLKSQKMTQQQQPVQNQTEVELGFASTSLQTMVQQLPTEKQVFDAELGLPCEGQETTEQQLPTEKQVLNSESVATVQQPYEVLPSQLYMLTTVGDQQVLVPVSVACLSETESVISSTALASPCDQAAVVNELGRSICTFDGSTRSTTEGGIGVPNSAISYSAADQPPVEVYTMKKPKSGCKQVYDKSNFCIFCEKEIHSKIARHLLTVHKDNPRMKDILKLAKRSRQRVNALHLLANEGNLKHNAGVLKAGVGKIVVSHRASRGRKVHKPNEFAPCTECQKFVLRKTLWLHHRKCIGRQVTKATSEPAVQSKKPFGHISALSKTLLANLVTSDDEQNLSKVLSRMRDDSLKQIVQQDDIIRRFLSLRADSLGPLQSTKNNDVPAKESDVHRIS